MPRKMFITCKFCGQTKRKPVVNNHIPIHCSQKCKNSQFIKDLELQIGDELHVALDREYAINRKSVREIAAEWKLNERTVMKLLRDYRINVRHGSEAVKTQWENNDERRIAIGKIFAESAKNNVGPNHRKWKGGVKIDYQLKTAELEILRNAVRERDGLCCTKCGMTAEAHLARYNRQLHVHHVIPFVLSEDHSMNNLRTLCWKCHTRADEDFVFVL